MDKVEKFIKAPRKALYKLAVPMIVSMVVQTMYNIVDTVFVGRLGGESIAALTFSFPIFFIMFSVIAGLSTGMSSAISRSLGARKIQKAENIALHGLISAFVVGSIIVILGNLFLDRIFLLFGARDNVLILAESYMRIILMGIYLMYFSFAMNNIFSAQGDTKTPMYIQSSSLILNIILDPIFIYGLEFGVSGAAIATVIAFSFSLSLYILFSRKSKLRIKFRHFHYNPTIIKSIFKVGAPAGMTMLLLSFYVIFLNRYMVHFSNNHVAAFGIASRLETIAIMPMAALAIALLTLVGMFHGAKRHELVREISWYGIKIAVTFSSSMGIIFFIFARYLLRIFTPEQAILSLSIPYLRIDVLTFPLMAVAMLSSRIMQGLGYGVPGLVINLIRVFLVAVPLGYLFVFILNYSYLSIAWAMVLGGVVSNIVALRWLFIRFKSYKTHSFK